jgi:hypothetical protein
MMQLLRIVSREVLEKPSEQEVLLLCNIHKVREIPTAANRRPATCLCIVLHLEEYGDPLELAICLSIHRS